VHAAADVSGYAVVSRAVLHRQLSEGLGAVSWGSRPQGPARTMDPCVHLGQHPHACLVACLPACLPVEPAALLAIVLFAPRMGGMAHT
jgi:hypothetical protein